MPEPTDVTQILLDLANEDEGAGAADRLYQAVNDELRQLAGGFMRGERPNHTLQPTALVNEAYLKLVNESRTGWESRAHFFGAAARAMRQILVDHARKHNARKRGGDLHRVSLDENIADVGARTFEIIAMNDALEKLAKRDERMARVVELRIFGGLPAKEVAHVLGFSKRTVDEDWKMAKAWLARELGAREAE